jgi:hypothetical protein
MAVDKKEMVIKELPSNGNITIHLGKEASVALTLTLITLGAGVFTWINWKDTIFKENSQASTFLRMTGLEDPFIGTFLSAAGLFFMVYSVYMLSALLDRKIISRHEIEKNGETATELTDCAYEESPARSIWNTGVGFFAGAASYAILMGGLFVAAGTHEGEGNVGLRGHASPEQLFAYFATYSLIFMLIMSQWRTCDGNTLGGKFMGWLIPTPEKAEQENNPTISKRRRVFQEAS